ncbi:hypothetical protein FOXG_21408 [Fusarium oxysporum f. sp. lycopersici 4287]|uniref:Uncharacterized protein n=1 Tax=Fusarium oxysporum f. sp. lycopersici (strain 4287 / CBS 123668 / FGSC 9935 / NRRL 34936) TaxID=426428 RepID=A0A0J9WS59_FUSO4|nr:hypothetical protein FOXG_20891 [Fusarium oxysporum f. sp. lycopersici 4287]XP_018253668.1 hypothetical protein FOXG_21408 [Fusarium oxysporum f. sp. lycopersici 4287]KNB13712.1 hypothetical protein FOXG_20891 [Fusarium oxysporum f. sp. lycopersici 4287]KNB15623.1 hypothetical protein FOXG_21408 [Fusarium oxysporum f. sp. lycopersici 4287]
MMGVSGPFKVPSFEPCGLEKLNHVIRPTRLSSVPEPGMKLDSQWDRQVIINFNQARPRLAAPHVSESQTYQTSRLKMVVSGRGS